MLFSKGKKIYLPLSELKKQSAFTLMELIVVIAVLVIIASFVIVAVDPNKRIGNTNDSRRWSDITAIAKAIELYATDYGQLPADFSTSTVPVDTKVVLCSSSATLTCDGQSKGCLLVDDEDFLGVYLSQLPVDPLKTATTDTGYYLTRNSNNTISIGACSSYSSSGVSAEANIELPTYVSTAVCGNGELEYGETCDDGDAVTETQTCGNTIKENGTYCNDDCTAEVVLTEACDYVGDTHCGSGIPGNPYENAVGCASATYCSVGCGSCVKTCPI